jgi:hypothetical protein
MDGISYEASASDRKAVALGLIRFRFFFG